MKSIATFCLTLVSTFLISSIALSGETITVDGTAYPNSEMVEISKEGVIYKTEGGEHVTLPWASLSPAQVSAVKARHKEGLMNAVYDAYVVKGSVFHVNQDGVIIQVSQEDAPDPPYLNGAKVMTSGLVLIKDLPRDMPRGEGAPIDVVAYKRQSYTFDMGIAVKEIPYMTVAYPMWAREQEWENVDGQMMAARLIASKDGKCLFEKGGKTFVYPLDKLTADAQKRVAEYQERIKDFPIP